MSRNKQIIAVAVLSLLIAVQSYFLVAEGAPTVDPQRDKYSRVFDRAAKSPPARTLRPDGQTEHAERVPYYQLRDEVAGLPTELIAPMTSLDSLYVSPTDSTARLILKRAFRKLEDVYVPEAYDCDDNAHELLTLLRKEALVEYREYPAALAAALICVRIDGRITEYRNMTDDPEEYPMYHAMVALRVKGGRWLLIEPLTD